MLSSICRMCIRQVFDNLTLNTGIVCSIYCLENNKIFSWEIDKNHQRMNSMMFYLHINMTEIDFIIDLKRNNNILMRDQVFPGTSVDKDWNDILPML